jgi:hypothetical protein
MAARSRPRQHQKDDSTDAHEERNLWLQMLADLKKLRTVNQRAIELTTEICKEEERMGDDDGESQIINFTILGCSVPTHKQRADCDTLWQKPKARP